MAPLRGGAVAVSTACLLGCAVMASSQIRMRGARLIGTYPVGLDPRALAIDPRSGDLFPPHSPAPDISASSVSVLDAGQ